MMIFGFVGSALIGAIYYFVPRLPGTPLQPAAARVALWIWNLAITAGTVTLALGYTQSREYAEWIWPVDIMVLVVLALTFYNLLKTEAAVKKTFSTYLSGMRLRLWYSPFSSIFSATPSGTRLRAP